MNIKPISFRVNVSKNPKNTFSQKAKNTTSSMVKKYYKSLDSEARARLEYLKFKKANDDLDNVPNELNMENILSGMKIFFRMAKHKLNSVIHESDSFHYFPERFYEADNPKAFPKRHYKLSSPSRTLPWE